MFLRTATLSDHTVAYKLRDLINQLRGDAEASLTTRFLSLQSHPDAGAAELYVGDTAKVGETNCGVMLFAGQSVPYFGGPTQLVPIDEIWLATDTDGHLVNIAFL